MVRERDVAVVSKKNLISGSIRGLVRVVAEEIGTEDLVDPSGAVVLARPKDRRALNESVREARGAVAMVYTDMGGEGEFGPEAYRWDYGARGKVLAVYATWRDLLSLLGDATGLVAVKGSGKEGWWGEQHASFPADSSYSRALRQEVRQRAVVEQVRVRVDESGPVYIMPRDGGVVEQDEVHTLVSGMPGVAGGTYEVALVRDGGGEGSDLQLVVGLQQMVNLVVLLSEKLKLG